MKTFWLILLAALLSSCADLSKVMVNDRGEKVACAYRGIGWFGASYAAIAYNHCVDSRRAQGYRDTDEQFHWKEGPYWVNE